MLKVWDEAKPDTKKGNTRLFGPLHKATTERQKKNQPKKMGWSEWSAEKAGVASRNCDLESQGRSRSDCVM